jgi:hypothetical protein
MMVLLKGNRRSPYRKLPLQPIVENSRYDKGVIQKALRRERGRGLIFGSDSRRNRSAQLLLHPVGDHGHVTTCIASV